MRQFYASLAGGGHDALLGADAAGELEALRTTVELGRLVEIEQRTPGR